MRPIGGKSVGDEMLQQKCTYGKNSAQGMQTAQQKGIALSGAQGRDACGNPASGNSFTLAARSGGAGLTC
jgi:hypothetical protein